MVHAINIVIAARNTLFGDLVEAAVIAHGHNLMASYHSLHTEESFEGCDVLVAHLIGASEAEISVLIELGVAFPDMAIVVLCEQIAVNYLCDTLGTTTSAIIADDKPVEVLISALQIVANGLSIVHPSRLAQGSSSPVLTQKMLETVPSERRLLLSERELAILGKVHDGYANKEIARQLEISDSTVKAHLRSIFQKTGLKNRTQAAIWVSSLVNEVKL